MGIKHSVVGRLWVAITLLVAVVLLTLGGFLLQYIDIAFKNSHEVKVLFIYTCIIGFLLSTLLAFFFSTQITQPLIALKKAAVRISQGEYDTRVSVDSHDEIGELAASFNAMSSELESLIRDLNNEKDHLSSVLRSMTDAVVTFDAEGNIILSNPPAQQILSRWNDLDWDIDEPLSSTQVPAPLCSIYERVLQEGRDVHDKVLVQSGVWSVVMAPLKSNTVVRGAVVVMRDITEENQLEKLRRDFVANVSHELRTPLSMLQGYTEALQDNIVASEEDRAELISVIHDETLRMSRLVEDLLDLAVMESNQFALQLNELDLVPLLQRVHRKFQVFAKERGVHCQLDCKPKQLVIALGDEDRIEQVLTNLLDNALRHTPAGRSIHLRAAWNEDKSMIELFIIDEGEGIPHEDIPFIFDRFYKADKARRRSGGTGLGLAIVKNIIVAHQGKIEVTSAPGKGTIFNVALPR